MPRRPRGSIDHELIVERFHAGDSYSEIARRAGCTPQTVTAVLGRRGLSRQPRPALDVNRVLAMLDAGLTRQAIAKAVGISSGRVTGIARQHGRPVITAARTRNSAVLDDREWLADCYVRGLTLDEIADLSGVDAASVARLLRDIGLANPAREQGSSVPELNNRRWLTARYPRRSATAIAGDLGVTSHTVLVALRRHGIAVVPAQHHLRNPRVADDVWLARRLDEGLTQQQIADLAGCEQSIVSLAVERLGRRRRRTPVELADRDWLADQIAAGRSDKDIASQFGFHPGSVTRWRLRHRLYRRAPTGLDR